MIPPSIISRGIGWQVRIQILYRGLNKVSLYHLGCSQWSIWNNTVRALASCLIHFLGQPTGHRFQCKYICETWIVNPWYFFFQNRVFCQYALWILCLQGEYWIACIDTCWQPKSSTNICWVHDFLLCPWYINWSDFSDTVTQLSLYKYT